MSKRRKVSHPMALALLALVAERPMHPYEMASVLRERAKDRSIDIKWGSLYTVVGNLEKHGFIEAAGTMREGRRPERTTYRITAAGLEEMRDWLRELLGNPVKEYRGFEAALSLLPGLPPGEVSTLLERRLSALDARISSLRGDIAEWSRTLPRLFLVEAEYELVMLEAEAAWTRLLVAEVAQGTLPGLREWQVFHESGELPPEWQREPEEP